MKRSKRIAAWDWAWQEIGSITGAGCGQHKPTPLQKHLDDVLERLCDAPLPAQSISDVAVAIRLAWRIGRG